MGIYAYEKRWRRSGGTHAIIESQGEQPIYSISGKNVDCKSTTSSSSAIHKPTTTDCTFPFHLVQWEHNIGKIQQQLLSIEKNVLTEEEFLITNFSLVVTPFKREESHSPNLNGCIHHLHHQHTIHSSFVLGTPCCDCTLKCSFCIWQGKTSLRINYVQLTRAVSWISLSIPSLEAVFITWCTRFVSAHCNAASWPLNVWGDQLKGQLQPAIQRCEELNTIRW